MSDNDSDRDIVIETPTVCVQGELLPESPTLIPIDFTIKAIAEDYNGNTLEYPNTWKLNTGNPEENWQAILVYLEERYGNQSNKSIKIVPYPEDIANLSILTTQFPDREAAKIWLNKLKSNKVMKHRAISKDGVGRLENDDLFLDLSIQIISDTPLADVNLENMALGELFRYSKESPSFFTPSKIANLKSKCHEEDTIERKLILQNIIQQFGKRIL